MFFQESGDSILEWHCSWKLWLSSVWTSALIKLGYVVSTQLLFCLSLNVFVIELFSTHCTCWISCVVHLFNATDFKTFIYIYIYIYIVWDYCALFSLFLLFTFISGCLLFLCVFGYIWLFAACMWKKKKKIPSTNLVFKTRFMVPLRVFFFFFFFLFSFKGVTLYLDTWFA